jgi:hypothetical protein
MRYNRLCPEHGRYIAHIFQCPDRECEVLLVLQNGCIEKIGHERVRTVISNRVRHVKRNRIDFVVQHPGLEQHRALVVNNLAVS